MFIPISDIMSDSALSVRYRKFRYQAQSDIADHGYRTKCPPMILSWSTFSPEINIFILFYSITAPKDCVGDGFATKKLIMLARLIISQQSTEMHSSAKTLFLKAVSVSSGKRYTPPVAFDIDLILCNRDSLPLFYVFPEPAFTWKNSKHRTLPHWTPAVLLYALPHLCMKLLEQPI
jgi:hypothetical protein